MMRNYISSHDSQSFKVINLDTISYVDFNSSNNNPNTPQRCTVYFMNGQSSISLDTETDAQGLLEAMRSYEDY